MLPAMMTSLAFPERRVLRVDLYPRVTGSGDVSFKCFKRILFLAHKCDQLQGGGSVPFPDFITSARRELIPSEDFLVFFVGAISAIV